MSNKNPFEIRLDALKMSKEYLDRIQDVNTQFAFQAFEAAVESGKATIDQWEKFAPKQYDFKDVITKAQELYAFVNKKD